MAKRPPQPLHAQGATDRAASPYETRRQLDPMPADEAEAFDWAIHHLSEKFPDASFNGLIDEGISEGWFYVRDDDALAVNPEGGREEEG